MSKKSQELYVKAGEFFASGDYEKALESCESAILHQRFLYEDKYEDARYGPYGPPESYISPRFTVENIVRDKEVRLREDYYKDYAKFYIGKANTLKALNRPQEALVDVNNALLLDPSCIEALNFKV